MIITILFIAVCCVAFTNGANANFKGVASLYGSGTTSLRTATYWGTATTFAGSIAAIFLAEGLLSSFKGRGIVADSLVSSPNFLASIAMGGALTSFAATRLGFPVSTTHALIGAILGAGLAGGSDVHIDALGALFIYPLFFSPIAAMLLGVAVIVIYKIIKIPDVRTPALDALHFLSAGAASFTRGLNDTPKIVAPLLTIPALESHWAILIVGSAIALGGLIDIRNVAETLGKKVTDMNPRDGLAASLVTASLVATASMHSLPVSTTHVSVGSLLGIGTVSGQAHWRKVGEIALAWICTVPCGALLSALAYAIISAF